MPQGRRKVPFSGKAKKEQLKVKKQTKAKQGCSKHSGFLQSNDGDTQDVSVEKINFQRSGNIRSDPNRYALHFFKESNEEIKKRKELARQSLTKVTESELDVNGECFFDKILEFPKRPPWSFGISKEQLEAQENKYFTEYVNEIEKNNNPEHLSFFELNLETWRQLWRVLEMSDIVLFIIDARYGAVMFPPSLYEYVTDSLKKEFILVLNKIDLIPADIIVAWKQYFIEKYPNMHIVMFTSLPGYNLRKNSSSSKEGLQIRRKKGKVRMAVEGTQHLYDICKNIVGSSVDLTSWQQKIKEEMATEFDSDEKVQIGETIQVKHETEYFEYEKFKHGILTIGCIGQPNVGKSSLMNAVMGKKVVSVSRTPGHTKHFQTIYLTNNVKLCDCPGLVFPSKVPKPLQVLMGSFPIAQLRDPFTCIKYLAERIDLVTLLKIQHPDGDDTWSAMDICDGWAKKRGYITAKAARLDSYRAANSLLRMALDGKICLCLRPSGYTENKDFWMNHPEVERVKWIQASNEDEPHLEPSGRASDSSDNSEDEQESADDENSKESENSATSEGEECLLATNKFATLGDE